VTTLDPHDLTQHTIHYKPAIYQLQGLRVTVQAGLQRIAAQPVAVAKGNDQAYNRVAFGYCPYPPDSTQWLI
jgi:hypothetical protein